MLDLPQYVSDFMKQFRDAGYQIYLVGGAVRDRLLKRSTENWDFTTNATPEEVIKLFPDGFYNNQFGTVGIEIMVDEKKYIFEVTTFRKESDYSDHRHPAKIEWATTIEEDLARRDFTINAMAFDGSNLVDPYQGKNHLDNKLIVAVGNPDRRFNEDALRLMRSVRFATQLEFTIDPATMESIRKNAELITQISWERIRDEFLKIVSAPNGDMGILLLKDTQLLHYIMPELETCFGVEQKSPQRHHIYDVGTHLVMSLKHCPSTDPVTRLATLLHDIGKAETYRKDPKTNIITFYNHEVAGAITAEKIANRLRLSNKQKLKLLTLIRHHQFTVSEVQSDKAVRRFIRQVTKEYLDDMIDLRIADRIGSGATPTSWRFDLFKKRLEEVQKEPFKITDLKIDGNDVMKTLGLKPGPQIGTILSEIFTDVEEGKLTNDRDQLLNVLSARQK
jgi:tRNA nucleotidyltransferase (CCA-adding enzyme)